MKQSFTGAMLCLRASACWYHDASMNVPASLTGPRLAVSESSGLGTRWSRERYAATALDVLQCGIRFDSVQRTSKLNHYICDAQNKRVWREFTNFACT